MKILPCFLNIDVYIYHISLAIRNLLSNTNQRDQTAKIIHNFHRCGFHTDCSLTFATKKNLLRNEFWNLHVVIFCLKRRSNKIADKTSSRWSDRLLLNANIWELFTVLNTSKTNSWFHFILIQSPKVHNEIEYALKRIGKMKLSNVHISCRIGLYQNIPNRETSLNKSNLLSLCRMQRACQSSENSDFYLSSRQCACILDRNACLLAVFLPMFHHSTAFSISFAKTGCCHKL